MKKMRAKRTIKKRIRRFYYRSRRQISEMLYIRRLKRKDCKWQPLTQEEVLRIRRMDDSVYSGGGLKTPDYQDFRSLAEVYHCKDPVQLEAHLGDDWYILLIHHPGYIEIADLAVLNGKPANSLFFLKELLAVVRPYQDQQFLADCRDITSYRIVETLRKMNRLETVWEDQIRRGGEPFHKIMFRLNLEHGT